MAMGQLMLLQLSREFDNRDMMNVDLIVLL